MLSKKNQTINFIVSIICSAFMIIDIISKWWVHQNIEDYAGVLIFNSGNTSSSIINNLIEARDTIAFLITGIMIISILFTLVSFIGIGMGEIRAKMNFFILGMYLAILAVFIFFNNPALLVNFDYKTHSAELEKVVSMVEKGDLGKLNIDDQVVDLPKEYKNLSMDSGKIEIFRQDGNLTIYFTTYRGMLSNDWSVIAYSSNSGGSLNPSSTLIIDKSKELAQNWFWGEINR